MSLVNIDSRKQITYGAYVVMRHPKRARFLNPAPDSFKKF